MTEKAMHKFDFRLLLIAGLVTLATGCGGTTSGQGDNDNGDGDPDNGPVDDSVRIGSVDNGGNFNEGVIGSNQTVLQAGQRATLSLRLIDGEGDPVTDGSDVFFTSACAESSLAEIDPAVVANESGNVTTTYTARGCSGADTVTARTDVDGGSLQATVTLQTEQAPLGAIQFQGASNPLIGIQGSGALPGQSTVTFAVTNNSGGPVPNQLVTFELNTTVGGISLSNAQATTGPEGIAQTTISSGTQATTVQVTATATRDGVTTTAQSNGLAITTGIPDNNSFSVSADTLNIEGFDIDGTTTAITVRAADRFNNPVPDGTAVNFLTEGGSIPGSCETTGGNCTVEFVSQNPRPTNGRATVRVTTIGEESFTDANPSNGRFDAGETFMDLPEAFRDDNENGVRDTNEPFVDFNNDGSYTGPSGNFTGLLCNDPAVCDDANTLNVRRNIVIVMSGSSYFVDISPDPLEIPVEGAGTVNVTVQDANGQIPAANTTVTGTTSVGTLEGPTSFVVPNRTGPPSGLPFTATFRVEAGDEPESGVFRIEATSPSGVISRGISTVNTTAAP